MKDWVGNGNSIFKSLGASNHTDKERQSEDFYATDPLAAELLLQVEELAPKIWPVARDTSAKYSRNTGTKSGAPTWWTEAMENRWTSFSLTTTHGTGI